MPVHATTTDPRSIVTPDAFQVSGDLLGMPLARPARRLAAILVDLLVIGAITLLTSSFALILGVVAAAFFLRMSFKRTRVRGSVFGRAMRLSLGCLGLSIGAVTAVVWVAVSASPDLDDLDRIPGVTVRGGGPSSGAADIQELAGLLGGGVGLIRADDAEEARVAMGVLVRQARAAGTTDAEIREAVLELAPGQAAWSADAEEILDEVMAATPRPGTEETAAADTAGDSALRDTAAPSVPTDQPGADSPSVPAALEEYATLLRSPADPSTDARRAALRDLLIREVASDTLAILEAEVARLDDVVESRQDVIRGLRQALDQAEEGGGFFAWLRTVVDELGFGFGWASLYMTVVLSWWKGRTVGKKLLGIRVVRLDGEPITWWIAFERAGGYAAGFATGLLGFAQVWWDANRQAIHDRIVGTVVVMDDAEPVGNWNQAP